MENNMTSTTPAEERLRADYEELRRMNDEARALMQKAYDFSREKGLMFTNPKIKKVRGRRPRRDYDYTISPPVMEYNDMPEVYDGTQEDA